MKRCQICGKPIEYPSRAKKYCSPKCRAKVKYQKDRAWLAAHPGKAAEYARNYYAAHADACKQAQKKRYLKKCLEKYQEDVKNGKI